MKRPSAARTNAPSSGTFWEEAASIGSTVMRTVDVLTEAITISTGIPATTIGERCPRSTVPESATPAPAVPRCFKASRREIGEDMPRMLAHARLTVSARRGAAGA
jgi:hypothetical protein